MKKFMALFFMLVPTLLWARSVSVATDLRDMDALWESSLRIEAEVGVSINEIKIVFPIRYGKEGKNTVNFVECGALVEMEPFNGCHFFLRASLLKVGWIWGIMAPEESLYFSAEGSVGWKLQLGRCFLTPMLTYRDRFTAEELGTGAVKRISQFSDLRTSLLVGIDI